MDKWQTLKNIIHQHPTKMQDNSTWQFKKLRINRFLTENILIFLLQYVGFMISSIHPEAISPLWFFSGTAGAFIFIRGHGILTGIFLGSFISYYFITNSVILAFICALLYSLQIFLFWWCNQRYVGPTLIFCTLREFTRFLAIGISLTASFCLITAYLLYSFLNPVSFFELWLRWWLANFNGILIFSFALVTWDYYFSQIDSLISIKKLLPFFVYGSLLLTNIFLLFSQTPLHIIFFSLCSMPLILIISIKLRWCGTITAIFALGILFNFGAYLYAPLFTSHFSVTTLIFLQFILFVESIIGLFLAIITENKHLTGLNTVN